MAANNTIVLKGDQFRWHDEKRCDTTAIKPGMLIELKSNGKVQPHSTRGGRSMRYFAKEDDLRGGTIDGVDGIGTAYYVDGDLVLIHKAQPGDNINALLKAGENVAVGDWAVSFGDGTICKAASSFLAENTAASTAVSNTTTETAFSNGTVTIPANTLKVGDVIRVRAQGIATSTNSTDTLNVKLKIGTTVIVATGALDVANNDIFLIDATLVIRTIGAAGTFIATGTVTIGASGTATAKAFNLAETAIDTTAAQTITVTATWSVASPSNSVRQDILLVEQVKASTAAGAAPSTGDILGQFQEAVDLSASLVNDFAAIEIAV